MVTLKIIQQVSYALKVPVIEWLREGSPVKYVGDDVDKKGVHNVRSDQRSTYAAQHVLGVHCQGKGSRS